MRSIDVFKCWPFTSSSNNQLTRDQLHSWLPPMSPCPSRSNQNHQPSTQHDDEQSSKSDKLSSPPASDEMICPVCRQFNAATLTAVNAHIDGCLAQSVRVEHRHIRIMNSKSKAFKSLKSKSKSPKKRSIAEIFKVEDKDKYKDQQHQEEKEEEPMQNESVMKLKLLQLPPEEEDVVEEDQVSLTVRKFRWLSQRLEALRSKPGGGESAKESEKLSVEEEKLEMICPVCKDFNAATVTAVNAHIDSCLGKAVRDERRQIGFKSKPKAPKKRSIAEILNVVPPIEVNNSKSKTVEVEEDEDEDKFSDYSGEESSASDAAATFVSITKKKKKSLNKNSKNKKMKKTKKKKMGKYCDSGVLLNNEVKKKKMNMKKKKKMNIFNSEFTRKKVCSLCLMKYKLIFLLYDFCFHYLKLIHG